MVQDYLIPDFKPAAGASFIIKPTVYNARTSKFTDTADSVRQMLAKTLIHPYAQRAPQEYYNYMARLMAGDTKLDLGRPKYLSDQLWNKTLLNTVYYYKDQDESGPKAESAMHRGIKDPNTKANLITATKNLFDDETEYVEGLVLGYIDSDKIFKQAIKVDKKALVKLGLERYNTVLVRNLDYITNIQRIMRLIMRDQLRDLAKPIITGQKAINRNLTEFPQETTTSNVIDMEYF
jgi:hypothetical protein